MMARTAGPVDVVRADALAPGDQFWSPAGRWETVISTTKASDNSVVLRIATDKVTYPWPLVTYREVQVIPASGRESQAIAVEETTVIRVVLMAANAVSTAWQPDHVVLADGRHLGTGKGWVVSDRPDDVLVSTNYPTRAAARSALIKVARAYAKALKVPYRGRIGGGA